jgi:hypothetical protein
MSGGYAASSQLLAKQAELKQAQADYEELRKKFTPNALNANRDNYTQSPNINAISNVNPPPGISPGEDFGEFWKGIKDPSNNPTADTCIRAAAADSRLFKTVVYTGNANLSPDWNKKCYGLIYDAPPDALNMTNTATGYLTNTPKSGYTKLDVSNSVFDASKASKMYNLQLKVENLINDIFVLAPSAISNSIKGLSEGATDSNVINDRIKDFMNNGSKYIDEKQTIIAKTQNRINLYDDINSQIQLNMHKYRFFIYFIITLILVVGLISLLSKLTFLEQIINFLKLVEGKWWANWYVFTFVTVLLILSSFGWDMRGNIMMVMRYVTDPVFWSGELWWIGITFLLLFVIYIYTSFKSFFTGLTPSLDGIGSKLNFDMDTEDAEKK